MCLFRSSNYFPPHTHTHLHTHHTHSHDAHTPHTHTPHTHHTHSHAHTPHTHIPHTHTDELIQSIRQDIAIASEKLEDPPMKELAVQLDNHLRTKHLD